MTKFIIFHILVFQISWGQSVTEDLLDDENPSFSSLPSEEIVKISQSKRIFIVTKEESAISTGDFISLIYKGSRVARAMVAKESENHAGIKILKIYSLAGWKQLVPGLKIQIIRGDDSGFFSKKRIKKEDTGTRIETEDDLFNKTSLKDDVGILDQNTNRDIQGDNIASLSVGRIEARNSRGHHKNETHINAAWAYQFWDNVFGEFLFGQNIIRDYPADGLDTRMLNYTLRVKFTFNTSFFALIQPYAGYQVVNSETPGLYNDISRVSDDDLAEDIKQIEDLEKKRIVFGVSVLKKLVPAWFVKLDLGVDLVNLGLSVEF